jgi:hypothetical protein
MIGDSDDIRQRIKTLLPEGWFRGDTPVLDALLSGMAYGLSLVYSLIQYAKAQARIATASDGFLDLVSYDFFGTALPRRQQEMDDPFRARILATLLREKATRNGMIAALVALTGRTPKVFEPGRPADTGAYGASIWGYGVAGGYGSLAHRAQAFITAFRPAGSGIPYVAGYGATSGGYSTPSRASWCSLGQVQGFVTDSDILATIDRVKPAGTIMWTALQS